MIVNPCILLQQQIDALKAQNTVLTGSLLVDQASITTAQAGVNVAMANLTAATNKFQDDTSCYFIWTYSVF